MANSVIVMGASGTGKSSSIRGLDPKETVIINVLGKRLPFKGSTGIYNRENKNLFQKDDYQSVIQLLQQIDTTAPHVKVVVIDDAMYIMRKEYFRRAKEAGYSKYTELAQHFQSIIQTCETLREDLIIFLMLHVEELVSDNTIVGYQAATVGKLLRNQYAPEEVVTTVLVSAVQYDDRGEASYGFYTHRCRTGTVELPAKCFARGTRIVMADHSLKNVEDIRTGDLVLNTGNMPGRVTSVHSGVDMMYRVRQKYGMDYTVNSQHLLCTDTGTVPAAMAAGRKDLCGIRQAVEYPDHIPEPYYLGIWLGSGDSGRSELTVMDEEVVACCRSLAGKYGLTFRITVLKRSGAFRIRLSGKSGYTRKVRKYDMDGNFLAEYRSLLKAAKDSNIRYASGISHCASGHFITCGGYRWEYGEFISHNPLRELLQSLDLLGNKHIPYKLRHVSLSDRLEFLAGIIDSSGTRSRNRLAVSMTGRHMAEELAGIACSCGFDARVKVMTDKDCRKEHYFVILSGDLQKIPVRVVRKQVFNPSHDRNCLTVEPVGKGDYFGFSLEGECKTCLLPDGTVVHNSPAGMFDEDFIPNDLGLVVKAMRDYY